MSDIKKLWNKIFSLLKLITGDVDVSVNGTLQDQIDSIVQKNCYSTTEKEIGEFVNGQPIYRKVMCGSNITYNGVVGNIGSHKYITRLDAYVQYGDGTEGLPISQFLKVENGNICTTDSFPTKMVDPECPYSIVVEYVK